MSERTASHGITIRLGCGLGLALMAALFAGSAQAQKMDPAYYLGDQVCRDCHSGPHEDNPYGRWRLLGHSRAYAGLARPEAWEIAEISGVDIEPQKSPICLGCHTTAASAEDWELNPGFERSDGVQCEACHGPASNYIEVHRMGDSEQSMMAGLKMPGEQDCMVCHMEKGTHVAVLKTPLFDYEERLARMMHVLGDPPMEPPAKEDPEKLATPHFTGSEACGDCHDGAMMGYQWSKWRRGPHARAYASLSTGKAMEIAERLGLETPPQESEKCLACHRTGAGEPAERFGPEFTAYEGIGCEGCHGPGSEYSPEAIMRDPVAAHNAGLLMPGEDDCRVCHNSAKDQHIGEFNFEMAWEKIAHPTLPFMRAEAKIYKTPQNLALSNDGRLLLVACEGSDSVILVDTDRRQVIDEITVENQPHDVCFSPDEKLAYVSNRGTDSVSVVDLAARAVIGCVEVGDEPHGLLTDVEGKRLYVANAGTNDISVIDLESLEESYRLSASRAAWSMARSPDGKHLLVTSALPHFVGFRTPPIDEVTRVDLERAQVDHRYLLHGVNLIQGVAWHPNGEFALATMLRTKNLVPMIRIDQNWVVSNAMGIIYADEKHHGGYDQVLLDEPMKGFADATDVIILPNGKYGYVSGAGVHEVAVIDIEKLLDILNNADEKDREHVLPNHRGYAPRFVPRRIPTGFAPRGIVASPDSRWVYVAEGLDDTIGVIDTRTQERVDVIDLGGPLEQDKARVGERVFHSGFKTFQWQFSCHTCHPDGGVDSLTYTIEPEGIGINPVDNRTLRGILDTAPFKWTGKNPSLSRQCGPRLAVFFTRVEPFTPEELSALDHYITTIPRNPNYHRALGEDLTDAQRRGKAVFERTYDNTGRMMEPEEQCHFCHSGSYYTNRQLFDVGTMSWLDTHGKFDVPHLNNIYETAPYLHDGRADTLEEIWTRFNPDDEHGRTNDLTKDQLNDLVEYMKTL